GKQFGFDLRLVSQLLVGAFDRLVQNRTQYSCVATHCCMRSGSLQHIFKEASHLPALGGFGLSSLFIGIGLEMKVCLIGARFLGQSSAGPPLPATFFLLKSHPF